MKVNKKNAVAAGALVAVGMLTLAGCAGNTETAPSESAGESAGALTVWVDAPTGAWPCEVLSIDLDGVATEA